MKTIHQLLTIFIPAALLSCGSIYVTPNLKKDSVLNTALIDTPRSFVRNYGVFDSNKLFAFVGEKLSVEPLPYEYGTRDNCFRAKYVILQKIFGLFPQDTIEFIAYDHYGIPAFSTFKNALLYVSVDSGVYYHQKYMYNDVYKTKGGRWAGAYEWSDYKHEGNKKTSVKPVKIDFNEPVFYPLTTVRSNGDTLRRTLPRPFFEKIGDSAKAIYGNYIEELFILKRDGVLTARGIFKDGKLAR